MRNHIIDISNLTYEQRLPLINYLKSKNEPIFGRSTLLERKLTAVEDTGLVFSKVANQWRTTSIYGRKTISILVFINRITFKEL